MGPLLTIALRGIGVVLYLTGLYRIVLWLGRRSPKVVAYHACLEREDAFVAGLGINTPPGAVARQLDWASRHYHIVPLTGLLNTVVPERSLAVTFDDGYRSVYENAFPLLRARRVPATLFLVPAVVGNEALVWVNELAWMLHERPDVAGPIAARRLCGRADAGAEAIMAAAIFDYDAGAIGATLTEARGALELDPAALARSARPYVTWEQVAEMAQHGVTVGNHTATHPNLARLGAAAQRADIAAAHRDLATRPGFVPAVAYPFGLADAAVRDAAAAEGYRLLCALGGSNRPLDPGRLARVPIATASIAVFFADVEVVTPVKAWLKRLLGQDS